MIENLELLDEKLLVTFELEKLLREGHLELAKARYIRGKESIGLLQIPSEETEIQSLFSLETTYVKSDKDANIEIPTFDISLKKSNKGEKEPQNPINWFGVLVPQNLKFAQKHFQDALYLAIKLANIQAQLAKVTSETASFKLLKEAAS
ncbi:PREDICTED: coiled-coil domain-containing protein 115-like isoform X2 [Ceratosolen solmsi marchali]|nr:PREDICTED: coiled-coil domain-containing protein 115-like isoform X2 [Ceratosolen solmsi marchali]